ncbi:SGNH/GDSL hydrolase family protein [Aureimonas sp. N4]|uniref:SGNH/GDSL hydrolase family protein n=1 Tax=Aureimonas sp. N4 TaxID=1638165 RepID=UPI00078439EC|nr:SGNH/GDSL hydrolase family protein [Aureimonas sp. N4]
MKTILCYGDSLTWGYDAEGPSRHAYADRWPSVIAHQLGDDVRIIPEGLNGRTTAYDDHLAAADRNGARILPTMLASHEPIDVVILALGTNDLKRHTGGGTAFQAAAGIQRLIAVVREFRSTMGFAIPDVLIVSPPALVPTQDPDFHQMFGGAIEESRQLKSAYARVAQQEQCAHLAASDHCVATPLDGVHLDAENTRTLGFALASALKSRF